MANVETLNTKTFANAVTDDAALVGNIQDRILQLGVASADVFSMLQGPYSPNSRAIMQVRTDLSKGAGQKVTFSTIGQLNARGKLGAARLRGSEEKPRLGAFSVTVDFVRHAVGNNEKLEHFLSAGMSYPGAVKMMLGQWLGRKLQMDALWLFRKRAQQINVTLPGWNTFYPGGRGSMDALTSADTFATDTMTGGTAKAVSLGCKAASITKSTRGAELTNLLYFAPYGILTGLKSSSAYTQALQNAEVRGPANGLFTGKFVNWDGNEILHWNMVEPDADGPIGSILEPRALLGIALADLDAAPVIRGGGVDYVSATNNYFDYFPGYDYQLFEEQDADVDSGRHYIGIYDPAQGKTKYISYVGSANTGQLITGDEVLYSSTTGTFRKATLTGSSITWDASKHTLTAAQGSIVFYANKLGNPIAWVLGLGAQAAARAYGKLPPTGKRVAEDDDYGMDKGEAIATVVGENVWQDTQNRPRNYVLIPTVYTPLGAEGFIPIQ